MRHLLALLVLTLALASPAGAQQASPIATPTLRGSQTVESPAVAGEASSVAATAAATLAQSFIPLRSLSDVPVAGDAGKCRLSCAQSYYFCLAGDGSDDCAPTWGQCRASCDAPGVASLAGG
ncbi:hypothetical protein [Phenylobacterium sp.]|uniref:hypothetical protein n=1 Tax=Phenylobacterium sp. TaxID=1871053 RepID=UPI0030F468EA